MLSLETIEERLTPANGPWNLAPEFFSPPAESRLVLREEFRPEGHVERPFVGDHEPARVFFLPRAEVAAVAPETSPPTTAAAELRETPARPTAPRPAVFGLPLIGATANGLSISGTTVAEHADAPPAGTAAAERPAGVSGGETNWSVAFAGTKPPDLPESEPAEPKPEPDAPAGPIPASPIERVIEAVLPVAVPLHGVLPLAEEWITAEAQGLLDRLESLTDDPGGGTPTWEQMSWLAGAVLVLGGVTYAVRPARVRPDRTVLGTDSALARWEQRHDRA